VRVLLLSDWMTEPGGSEAYMALVRDALRSAGDDVRLLTCGARDAAVGVADQRAWGTDRVVPQAFLQVDNPFATTEVRKSIREFQPDVALLGPFAYHLSPGVAFALNGVPTVLSIMDYKVVCPLGSKLLPDGKICQKPAGLVCWRGGCVPLPHWLRDQARYARIRRGVDRADVVLVPSVAVRDELARHGIVSRVLPLPIAAAPSPERKRAATPVFVYSGRLVPEKGLPQLLRAFARVRARVPDAHLRLVGDGGMRTDLERLVVSLGVQDAVVFHGRLPFTRVEQELVDAWALVAPSLWAEPFGMVAPEAIVRHVPVIATRTGGFADTVIDGVTGLLVPNGDESALADAMMAVAERRRFSEPMLPADAVAELVQRHDGSRYAARLRDVFTEILAPTRRRGAADT